MHACAAQPTTVPSRCICFLMPNITHPKPFKPKLCHPSVNVLVARQLLCTSGKTAWPPFPHLGCGLDNEVPARQKASPEWELPCQCPMSACGWGVQQAKACNSLQQAAAKGSLIDKFSIGSFTLRCSAVNWGRVRMRGMAGATRIMHRPTQETGLHNRPPFSSGSSPACMSARGTCCTCACSHTVMHRE